MHDETSRIRFASLDLTQQPNGRCAARVVLGQPEGRTFEGAAEGTGSPSGLLRCAAEAATKALEAAVEQRTELDLLGVTTIKAFDAIVVVTSLASHAGGDSQHLVGSAVSDGDPPGAAVRAVLNATNRLLGDLVVAR